MQRNPFDSPRGPVDDAFRVNLTVPGDMTDAEVREVMAKALRYPVEPELRQMAAADAAELRAEFTGHMRGFFEGYRDHANALDQLKRAAEAYPDRADDVAAIDRRIKRLQNRAEWQFRTLTYRYYRDQFMLGKTMAGNARPLDRAEKERIRRIANAEAQFGLRALADAETGEYFMDLTERGGLYGNAVDEMKWYGFLYADLSPGRYVRWVPHPAEHCIDCMWLAGKLDEWEADFRATMRPDGPTPRQSADLAAAERGRPTQGGRWGTGVYTAQELSRMAIVPQSGKLACTTNCKCTLEEVAKPAGRQVNPPMVQPWKSLKPKAKTWDRRRTRPKLNRKLSKLEARWADKHIARRNPEILTKKDVYGK